eukprot:403341853
MISIDRYPVIVIIYRATPAIKLPKFPSTTQPVYFLKVLPLHQITFLPQLIILSEHFPITHLLKLFVDANVYQCIQFQISQFYNEYSHRWDHQKINVEEGFEVQATRRDLLRNEQNQSGTVERSKQD